MTGHGKTAFWSRSAKETSHKHFSQLNSQMLGFKPPDKLSEYVCLGNQRISEILRVSAVVTIGATSRTHLKLRPF